MPYKLDEIDLRITQSLSEDSRKPTTQVAKEAGISRPTAISRIRNLVENRLVDFGAKVNVSRIGLKLALLTLETDSIEGSKDLVAKLSVCPRVLQMSQMIEKPKYSALICAENAETLISTIECLRDVLDANITSWQRVKPIIGETFDLRAILKRGEIAPCGKRCRPCLSYVESECVGCPATKDYKGPLRELKS